MCVCVWVWVWVCGCVGVCVTLYSVTCHLVQYYSGEVKAPILTLFVGGNHEASNHLTEL